MARQKIRNREQVKPTMIYLDIGTWEKGKALANHASLSLSEFISKLLEDKVDQNREQLEVLESLKVK